MNINVILLIIWLIAGVLNAIRNLQRDECGWVSYWLAYACLIVLLVERAIG